MYWCARQYPVTDCKDEAEVDEHTAIDVFYISVVARGLHNQAAE